MSTVLRMGLLSKKIKPSPNAEIGSSCPSGEGFELCFAKQERSLRIAPDP